MELGLDLRAARLWSVSFPRLAVLLTSLPSILTPLGGSLVSLLTRGSGAGGWVLTPWTSCVTLGAGDPPSLIRFCTYTFWTAIPCPPQRDSWKRMDSILSFIKHLIVFRLFIYKYLLSMYLMDQGYSSVKAKTTLSRRTLNTKLWELFL